MSGKQCPILLLVLLGSLIVYGVFGEEPIEEEHPRYEYIQIFRNLPALFEYLFDALEERPEILEKNDVTMFKRTVYDADVDADECESSDNDMKTDRGDAECEKPRQDVKNVDRRDTTDGEDVSETTIAYEYGNSNVVMKGLDELEDKDKGSNRFASTDYVKREIPKKESRINRRMNAASKLDDNVKSMFEDYGEAFFGFEQLFGLDLKPEDIEERILATEKLLEEHNNNINTEN